MRKLKIAAVSYLNTKPLLYGLLRNKKVAAKIDLHLHIPSECARRLKSGEVDLALTPVAIIPELDTPRIVSDYCIGTHGAVRTVCLFSERPLEEVSRILLDYHSRTSVELLKILLREYWHVAPELAPAYPGFETDIQGDTAGLVIGDRAIELESQFPHIYDLGEAWLAHTGLPFVFAAWISNSALPPDFLREFNAALKEGLQQIPDLEYLLVPPVEGFDLHAYFTKHISYELDDAKRQALQLFLRAISHQVQAAAPVLQFV